MYLYLRLSLRIHSLTQWPHSDELGSKGYDCIYWGRGRRVAWALSRAYWDRVRRRWMNQSTKSSITIHHTRCIELPRSITSNDLASFDTSVVLATGAVVATGVTLCVDREKFDVGDEKELNIALEEGVGVTRLDIVDGVLVQVGASDSEELEREGAGAGGKKSA